MAIYVRIFLLWKLSSFPFLYLCLLSSLKPFGFLREEVMLGLIPVPVAVQGRKRLAIRFQAVHRVEVRKLRGSWKRIGKIRIRGVEL